MKIVITGGHLSPALSLIEQLDPTDSAIVIGRKYTFEKDKTISLESQVFAEMNIPFYPLQTGRLQRYISVESITSLGKIPYGFFQALNILRKVKPDGVVTFGGYVALPVGLAAYMLRIPLIIHEQTLSAGFTNKILARFAKKICISWESSRKFFPKDKTVLTGLPLRKNILNAHIKQSKNTPPVIYITGGSAGAHGLNVLIEGCLEKLLKKYVIIHQVGDAREYQDYERLEELKKHMSENLRNRYTHVKFINPQEVLSVYEKADLVVTRSGINTVGELLYLGKPALLIPLPHGQNNEQKENAIFFKESGLGEWYSQKELTSEILYTHISSMLERISSYTHTPEAVRKHIAKDGAYHILEVMHKIVG